MFGIIAKDYDTLNRLLTWTLDTRWRAECAKQCISEGIIVDLCCGTGDLSLQISKRIAPTANVIGLDFSKTMLKKAREKKRRHGTHRNLSIVQADVAHLPFRDESIDCVGASFSVRNLIYKNPQAKAHLKEVCRMLRPNGKFVFVETSQPKHRALRKLYHLYLIKIVPLVGWLVSKSKNPYRYLGMSAANFPPAEEIAGMVMSAGFHKVTFKRLTLGLVALHEGTK